MKKAVSLFIISVISFLPFTESVLSQTSTLFSIHIRDSFLPKDTATMIFGNDVNATYDVDAALGELAAPPDPPGFFVRWTPIQSRISTSWGSFGLLVKDIRDIPVNLAKKDSFYLNIKNADALDVTPADSITLSWSSPVYINNRCDSMILEVAGDLANGSGLPGGRLNMATRHTITFRNPYLTYDSTLGVGWNSNAPLLKLHIFKYGTYPAWLCECLSNPSTSTLQPSSVGSTGATLAGSIYYGWVPCAYADTVIFQYGRTTDYGNEVRIATSGTNFSTTIGNLLPNTMYHYRFGASFIGSCEDYRYQAFGNDQTFTTDPPSSLFWMRVSDTRSPKDTGTMIFGNHVFATYDVDSALGELSAPPVPPQFMIMWNSITGRVNTWGTFGLMVKDIRELPAYPSKIDSFYLNILNPEGTDTDKIMLTWPDSTYINSRCDSIILVVTGDLADGSGIPGDRLNMASTNTVTIPHPYQTYDPGPPVVGWNTNARHLKLHIFKYGTKLPLPDAVKEKARTLPTEFRLEQNYPNPFNPETHFQFSIANLQLVSLKVYDLLGREVAMIVNEEMLPGQYTRVWDASGVPSGVYFYRMTAGRFVETKKLVVIR